MNLISACCHKSIVPGTRHEHPLNDRYSIGYKTDVCEECGKECDPVEACDHCGEPFGDGRVWETNLGEWCTTCLSQEVDKRAEEIRKEWGLGA